MYDAYVDGAVALVGMPSALEAELWLSAELGGLQAAAPHAEGHRNALTDLVRVMAGAETRGAVAFLRTFAAIGPRALRAAAARAADALVRKGVPEPGWAADAGDVVPGEVSSIQDGSLDREQIVCEFRYRDGTGRHALAVRLEQGLPTQMVAIGDVAAMTAQVGKAVEAEQCVVVRIDGGTTAERLRQAFAAAADLPGERRDRPWQDQEWFAYVAFSLHRIDALAGCP